MTQGFISKSEVTGAVTTISTHSHCSANDFCQRRPIVQKTIKCFQGRKFVIFRDQMSVFTLPKIMTALKRKPKASVWENKFWSSNTNDTCVPLLYAIIFFFNIMHVKQQTWNLNQLLINTWMQLSFSILCLSINIWSICFLWLLPCLKNLFLALHKVLWVCVSLWEY